MTVLFSIFATLGLFTCALPAGVFSVIWEQQSDNLTVGIPLIAILRTLLAVGVIAAVILSDRIREYHWQRDTTIGAAALEAMCLLGFSLSRVFWNLALWTLVLGFGMGLGISLICRMTKEFQSPRTCALYVGSALGAAAGVSVLSEVLELRGSWRTSCQVLAIVLVILCLILYFLRRRGLRDLKERLRRNEREKNLRRSSRRESLIERDGNVDERFVPIYFRKLAGAYLAALCAGLLTLGACLWPAAYQVAEGLTAHPPAQGILCVCLGMAAGRFVSALLKISGEKGWALSCAVTGLVLAAGALAASRGSLTDTHIILLQVCTGFGLGPVIPNLMMKEDERLDSDAEGGMTSLIPAFWAGGWVFVTPAAQALVGASLERSFCTWMLALAAIMGLGLALAAERVKR